MAGERLTGKEFNQRLREVLDLRLQSAIDFKKSLMAIDHAIVRACENKHQLSRVVGMPVYSMPPILYDNHDVSQAVRQIVEYIYGLPESSEKLTFEDRVAKQNQEIFKKNSMQEDRHVV